MTLYFRNSVHGTTVKLLYSSTLDQQSQPVLEHLKGKEDLKTIHASFHSLQVHPPTTNQETKYFIDQISQKNPEYCAL